MQGKRAVATLEDAMAFIRANTRVVQVHGLPLRMYQADELTPIWEATEKDLAAANVAPPFWAFPWAGGQALARYLIEHPEAVRGKVRNVSCYDPSAGSGTLLMNIAAIQKGLEHIACIVEGRDTSHIES